MTVDKDAIVSAQVLLRPASGRKIDGTVAITAENVAEFAPDPHDLSAAMTRFRSHGFEVGPFVGVGFSVTGPIRVFEEFFGRRLRLARDRAYAFVGSRRGGGHELAGDDLPEELRSRVLAVAFPLPPGFGPVDFRP